MKAGLLKPWDALRSSFWFVPTIMVVLAMGLALLSTMIDEAVGSSWIMETGWFYSGSAEGARALLSTVAGSMLTVAGVAFSITIAALPLASGQFGPRLLRNSMRDTGTQIVLGTFPHSCTACWYYGPCEGAKTAPSCHTSR